MLDASRFLILIGIFIVGAGIVVWLLGRWGFQGLPGDVRFETRNVRIYFPLATSLLLSLLLTALLLLWQWLGRR